MFMKCVTVKQENEQSQKKSLLVLSERHRTRCRVISANIKRHLLPEQSLLKTKFYIDSWRKDWRILVSKCKINGTT